MDLITFINNKGCCTEHDILKEFLLTEDFNKAKKIWYDIYKLQAKGKLYVDKKDNVSYIYSTSVDFQ